MKNFATLALLLALAVPLSAAPAPKRARDVVVRGGRDLADLLARSTMDAWRDADATRPVAVVVDVTPHVRSAARRLAAAFEALGDEIPHLSGSWRIGALGKKLGDPLRHPSALATEIDAVLAEETPEVNTLRALRKTLAGFGDRGGVVLYLADWRFEDDDDLEGLVSRLAGKGQSLRVIGSEACFGRAWNTGIPALSLGSEDYELGIGRSPFGPRKAEEPWHGGDTAYPHAPWSFGELPWRTEFPLGLASRGGRDDLEDLEERLGGVVASGGGLRLYPLSSAFGPYSLMRIAAETGGSYYLYSWNPSGRVDVVYDYGKMNIFEPDLRSRREILADAKSRPLPAAMLKAWRVLAKPAVRVADLTPPLTASGGAREIDRVRGDSLRMAWQEPADRDRFVGDAEKRIAALDEALRILDSALAAPPRSETPGPRHRADAALFRHAVHVLRFELREAVAVAREVRADAFDDDEALVALVPEDYIPVGSVEPSRTVRPRDPKEADAVRAARVRHMETYGGTPFGETVIRNSVVTWRIRKIPMPKDASDGDLGRTPSESSRDGPTTRPGGGRPPGGSGGAGPGTGR